MDKSWELREVNIDEIDIGARAREEYGDVKDLADDIKRNGLIQPIALMKMEKGYLLLAGGRRTQACRIANLAAIPARIYPDGLTELERKAIELAENIKRKDLEYVEAVKLKKEIHDLYVEIYGAKLPGGAVTKEGKAGWSVEDTARLLGESKSGVAGDIKLAKMIETVPELGELKNKAEASKLLKRLEVDTLQGEMDARKMEKFKGTPVEKQHEDLASAYKVQNFFDADLIDGTYSIVEVDPPYAIDLHDIKDSFGIQYNPNDYNEVHEKYYPTFLEMLFKKCYKAMSDNSWLIFWHAPDPWGPIALELMREAGFQVKYWPGIWVKPSGQTMQPNRYLASCTEYFIYARKGDPVIAQTGRSNVFTYKTVAPQYKVHPTERPIEMIQEVVGTFSWQSARGLVPFAGSGNTLLAMANLGIRAVGFDLSRENKHQYCEKVLAVEPGKYSSYVRGEEE